MFGVKREPKEHDSKYRERLLEVVRAETIPKKNT